MYVMVGFKTESLHVVDETRFSLEEEHPATIAARTDREGSVEIVIADGDGGSACFTPTVALGVSTALDMLLERHDTGAVTIESQEDA